MPQMRLDKLLSHLNCGSRKEVQALIRAGRVSVDGTVQKDPAFKVDPDRSQTAGGWHRAALPRTAVLHAQQADGRYHGKPR